MREPASVLAVPVQYASNGSTWLGVAVAVAIAGRVERVRGSAVQARSGEPEE